MAAPTRSLDDSGRQIDAAPAASASGCERAASAGTGAVVTTAATRTGVVDDQPQRVLVVEDDANQALFAETVLRGAGIQARAVRTAREVMPEMHRFQPDLVLLDLHMPDMTGTELISLIRAEAAFAQTPIVLLTGDPDPERQFEALDRGADDFIRKPVRPRHLIAAVQSRIQRARMLRRERDSQTRRDPTTGLVQRSALLETLGEAIGTSTGSALLVDMPGAVALRERYGYAVFDKLMRDAGRALVLLASTSTCTRLGDATFLVHSLDNAGRPADLARKLHTGIGSITFDCDGMPQRLRVAVGCAALVGFTDVSTLLDALGQAARTARGDPAGFCVCAPATAPAVSDTLIDTMQSALRDDGFELAFQPVVAVAGGVDPQFQALLRMREADGTLRHAATLIPAAEATGMVPQIDRWVLGQAVHSIYCRNQEDRALRLFVSQSARSLADDQQASWLLQQLAQQPIADGSLVIDLRLADVLMHEVLLRQFCETLAPASVRFCLSQYVHGPEADALLRSLPLHYVRLSPRYSGAHADPALRSALRGVIDHLHGLGLLVIGPQVEDPQGAAALWMSGVDLVQGNLLQQADSSLDFDFAHAVL